MGHAGCKLLPVPPYFPDFVIVIHLLVFWLLLGSALNIWTTASSFYPCELKN
jgi:hypothetical protein